MTNTINLDQEWHIGEQVGSGGFGRVFAAQSTLGATAVVKFIPKSPGADRELLFENLGDVPNVVPIIDSGDSGDSWVLVMPKAECSLRDYMDRADESVGLEFALKVLRDIAQALVAIDGRVVHRDIKPANLLLWRGNWCLADFGIARYADKTTEPHTRKFSMTAMYAAPEQWRSERARSATDVYSLGVVAYEMVASRLPFVGPEEHDYRQQHLHELPESISSVPTRISSLIDECLLKSPEARPNPHNLLSRLSDSGPATSTAGDLLQKANAIAVKQRAESDKQQSLAESRMARHRRLNQDATHSFEHVAQALDSRIMSNAPSTRRINGQSGRVWSLSGANLRLTIPTPTYVDTGNDDGRFRPPFEVAAYAEITLRVEPDMYQYEGRSHSFWYCDAKEEGVFRWYETAFMFNGFLPQSSRLYPFALSPGENAYSAVAPGINEYQVAWPFEAVDQGDEDEFVERWIGWFARATQGSLHRPSRMPEKEAHNSWRR